MRAVGLGAANVEHHHPSHTATVGAADMAPRLTWAGVLAVKPPMALAMSMHPLLTLRDVVVVGACWVLQQEEGWLQK